MWDRLGLLSRDADFRRLWAGQSISLLGSQIGGAALAFTAILFLGATPAQLGVLTAAGAIPALLIGLLVGVWVDRRARRPILVWSNVVRALLLATIPLAAVLGLLTMGQLYIVALLVAALSLLFEVAWHAFLPSLLAPGDLVEGNSKLGVSDSVAESIGPGIAGALVQVLSAPVTILLDSLSFILSAFFFWRIEVLEPPPDPSPEPPGILREIRQGGRLIARDAVQRALAGSAFTTAFSGGIIGTLYSLYALRELGLSPLVLGLVIGTGGLGALGGALLAGRAERRFGVGRTLLLSLLAGAAIQFLIPFAWGRLAVPMLVAAQILGDVGLSIFFINERSARQALTPTRLLGRVSATRETLTAAAFPLGALAGGWLGESVGLRAALFLGVGGMTLSALWILSPAIQRLRTIAPVLEEDPSDPA